MRYHLASVHFLATRDATRDVGRSPWYDAVANRRRTVSATCSMDQDNRKENEDRRRTPKDRRGPPVAVRAGIRWRDLQPRYCYATRAAKLNARFEQRTFAVAEPFSRVRAPRAPVRALPASAHSASHTAGTMVGAASTSDLGSAPHDQSRHRRRASRSNTGVRWIGIRAVRLERRCCAWKSAPFQQGLSRSRLCLGAERNLRQPAHH